MAIRNADQPIVQQACELGGKGTLYFQLLTHSRTSVTLRGHGREWVIGQKPSVFTILSKQPDLSFCAPIPTKGSESLGDLADFKVGVGQVQDKPGTSCAPKNQCLKHSGYMSGSILKGLTAAKSGTI